MTKSKVKPSVIAVLALMTLVVGFTVVYPVSVAAEAQGETAVITGFWGTIYSYIYSALEWFGYTTGFHIVGS